MSPLVRPRDQLVLNARAGSLRWRRWRGNVGAWQNHFDRHVDKVHKLLPASTVVRERDRTQFDNGGDVGIVVVATPDLLELRLPTVVLHGHEPVSSSVLWKYFRWDELKKGDLKKLVAKARAARKRQFKKCRYCGELVPYEHNVQFRAIRG